MKKELMEKKIIEDDKKILSFNDFIKFIDENKIDINNLKYSDVSDIIASSTFYKFSKKIKELQETIG